MGSARKPDTRKATLGSVAGPSARAAKTTAATMASAKKVAKTSGTRGQRSDAADDIICDALRARANELQQLDINSQQAARIVGWAASAEGKPLRDWMGAFKEQQASASTWQQAVDAVSVTTANNYGEALDEATAQWNSRVVSDGFGNPAEIDVVEYIDRLAYWIARTRMPDAWLRKDAKERHRHLIAIRTSALNLAALLEKEDSPGWPPAIELFEPASRPVWSDVTPLDTYRVLVSDKLRRQKLPQLLRNLADRSEQQERMDALRNRVPRPKTEGAFKRHLAGEILSWLEAKCRRGTNDGVYKLIADLINANLSRQSTLANEKVSDAEVKEWLRPPRKRAAKRAPRR